MNTEVPKDKRKEVVLTPAPRVLAEIERRERPIDVPDEIPEERLEERLEERPEERPIEEPIAGRYAVDAYAERLSDEEFATRLAEAEAITLERGLESAADKEARRKV